MSWVVDASHEGRRLDVVLGEALGESRSRAAARIQAGGVRVDGRCVAKRHVVRVGEVIEVAEPAVQPAGTAPPVPPIRYEDDDLLVLAKPAGLVVHAGAGHDGDTLVDALQAAGVRLAPTAGEARPGIVHRLDRDTSGLLLVAKTDAAYAGLTEALRARTVRRGYLALVRGIPSAVRGRIDAPIGRDERHRTRYALAASGRPAVTRYRLLARGRAPGVDGHDAVALLACRLETGRTHQIRVHLAGIGHGVVGDAVYGTTGRLASSLGLDRPFLHAASLAFSHPVTAAPYAFFEPLTDELARAAGLAGIDDVGPEVFDDG